MSGKGLSAKDALEAVWSQYKEELFPFVGSKGRLSVAQYTDKSVLIYDERVIAGWYLVQLTGCCGVVVSTSAYVAYPFRKKGLGTLLNRMRIDQARLMGYGQIMCTTVSQNEAQIRILEKNGWTLRSEFTNPRTGNLIYTYTYDL